MTRQEIFAKVSSKELSADAAVELLRQLERQPQPAQERTPPHFKVAINSGWCSVYFDGLRRPCTLPASLWLELLEPKNADRLRKFIEHNKAHFKEKR